MATKATGVPKAKAAPKAKLPSTRVTRAPSVKPRARAAGVEERPSAGPVLSPEERQKLIAQAAYFRAEKRGFAPGYELQDWIEAEIEVQRLIGKV